MMTVCEVCERFDLVGGLLSDAVLVVVWAGASPYA